MKKYQTLALFLMLPISQLAWSADADEAPFDELKGSSDSAGSGDEMSDIEKEIDAELARDKPVQKPSAKPKAAEQSALNSKGEPDSSPTFEEENLNAAEAGNADELSLENQELESSLEDELNAGAKVAKPTEAEAPADDSGLLSEGLDAPLEDSLEGADGVSAVDVLEAQLDNKRVFGTDGGDLQRDLARMSPSEIFARIPLRNPMSDQNWVKWAGPMIEKNYIVRKKDNLWTISTRLFGTPYLWPKIWHLNARVTNPNIIEAKTVLSFSPGNPQSAPEMAYSPDRNTDPLNLVLPLLKSEGEEPTTFMEVVDRRLRNALKSASPHFRDFLLEKKPRIYGELPKRNMEGRMYFVKGSFFKTEMEDGNYNVVSIDEYNEDLFFAYKMRWRGTLRVEKRQAEVTSTFFELTEGNLVVQRDFSLSPLAIHESTLGPVVAKKTKLIPLQESASLLVSTNQILGVRFPYSDSGPRPGAILTLDLGHRRTGKALLIDRDQRVGTLWLLSAEREVIFDDKLL